MSRKSRKLRPEERALWRRVAATAQPLHPQRRQTTPPPITAAVERAGNALAPPPPKLFFIGEAARMHARGPDLAPLSSDRLNVARVVMDKRRFARMKRGKLAPEARLDLHGMTLAEAHPALIAFVLRAHASGLRLLLVVTGKGHVAPQSGPISVLRGILRQQVPLWLAGPTLRGKVLQVSHAHRRHGGEGALYVYLRRSAP